MMFSCNGSGSANDVLAWRWSRMKTEVLNPDDGTSPSLLPINYFFIGDEAFVCERQFIVPWGGRGIGESKDAFNFHLSARRQVIERAFGILTRRWGIFARPLQCALSKWSLVCTVAAKLHNICIDSNIPEVARYAPDVATGDKWDVFLIERHHDMEYHERGMGES